MVKQKVATITFHRARNYGAVLQAVALQKAIIGLGYDSEVIDYDNRKISSCYDVIQKSSLKIFLFSLFRCSAIKRKNTFFDRFMDKELHKSRKVKKEDLPQMEDEYDKFITGSDQVWNYLLTGSDGAYFLDFVGDRKKKISYAASFGIGEIPAEKTAWYREMLQGFDYISVREATGGRLVKSITCMDSVNDLDPVFLLDLPAWKKIMAGRVPEKKYLFTYMCSEAAMEYAQKVADEKGLKIINVVYSKSILHPEKNVGDCRIDVSPEDFLAYLYHAEYVVTGSFHATAFSIIFNKQFKVGVPDRVGSRINDLLERTGLQQRVIAAGSSVQEMDVPIAWDSVNGIVAEGRSRSLANLQRSIEL